VVGVAQRREVVSFVQQEFGLSERRAFQLVTQPRAPHRYESRRHTAPDLLEHLALTCH